MKKAATTKRSLSLRKDKIDKKRRTDNNTGKRDTLIARTTDHARGPDHIDKSQSRGRNSRRSYPCSRKGHSQANIKRESVDRALSLSIQIETAISRRAEFPKYSERTVHRSARLFVKFGMSTIDEIKLHRQKHRDYFEGDMRKSGYIFGDLELIIDLLIYFRCQGAMSVQTERVFSTK